MQQRHRSRLYRYLRAVFSDLPRRAWLTLRHQGPREFDFRVLTFPLRLTPFGARFGLAPRFSDPSRPARRWYSRHWRKVAVVIPTYGAPDLLLETVKGVKATTSRRRVRIVVADDGSGAADQARLRELEDVELVLGESQQGFAANANRGLRATAPDEDVVLLNSDVIAHKGWLEGLQYAAYDRPGVGIVTPKLLYPDGTIQSAGSHRNLGAPEWFDHRYRFRPEQHRPANVPGAVIAGTGACLYVKRELLDRIGPLDESYGMAYEDVDWCLKAWEAGYSVDYWPSATLTHYESKTRGTEQGERELASQREFWRRWGAWFGERPVRAPDGRLRLVYVTEDCGVGGGHRVVFEHLNGLAERGHHPELWTLGQPPDWFDLRVPVRSFETYEQLAAELAPVEALKVATWWNTADAVWRASVRGGIPVYLVQDLETSYYTDPDDQARVLNSYRHEFRYLTTSHWVSERLRELSLEPVAIPPGVDLETFGPLDASRHERALLALARSNPLKNFELTRQAFQQLPEPRPELWLFGVEPEVGSDVATHSYEGPSDAEVNGLLNRATAFVQTSAHEGFCLPILEAMATGLPVVCTDAHGNRDFCRDGENCLMPDASPRAVADALQRILGDPALRERLAADGRRTAERYGWQRQLDEIERFYEGVAG